MLLIGMISFTVTGASFTNPENKQKTEFKADFVESQILFNAASTADQNFILFEKLSETYSHSAVVYEKKIKTKVFDVVLPSLYINQSILWQNYIYKEKLNKDLRLEVLSVQRDFMPDLLKS